VEIVILAEVGVVTVGIVLRTAVPAMTPLKSAQPMTSEPQAKLSPEQLFDGQKGLAALVKVIP
jgi:hypothetical protein